MSESKRQLQDSSSDEQPVHIALNFVDAIMTIGQHQSHCHPGAKYWLPIANIARLEVYLRLANIEKIESMQHFMKLLAARIIVQVAQPQ